MTSLWSAICEDIRFRHKLRYPQGGALFGWLDVTLFSRGTLILVVQRLSRQAALHRSAGRALAGRAMGLFASIGYKLVMILAKADVVSSTRIAPGVCISDDGNVVIGAQEIGSGTLIHHRVTIGMALLSEGRPKIGANVWIGPDCVIYGAIEVGDGATLLPGSVITKQVPARAVMAGNPARLVAKDFDNTSLRSSLKVATSNVVALRAVRATTGPRESE